MGSDLGMKTVPHVHINIVFRLFKRRVSST